MEKNKNNTADRALLLFDPIVLARDVVKRWYIIVLAALAVGVGAYIYAQERYVPEYQSQITFVVTNRESSSTVYSNLSSTSGLAPVFTEMMNSSLLQELILEELGTSWFDGRISAAVISETNLLTVTVTASNPRTSFLVARAIIDHHGELTYRIVDNVALEVLQWPDVPVAPSNSANAGGQMRKMMLLAAVAAMAVLTYISYVKDTVRSGKEARAKLDCTYLGEIPHEKRYKTLLSRIHKNRTSILITNPVISFRYVENIRKIRHRVEQRMDSGKVLMVTSALEDEGKSTVSINLALAMAQKCEKVLLIDCDLRKPACHRILDMKEPVCGVRDILKGSAEPAETLLYDKKRNLYMLLEKKGGSDSGDLVTLKNMRLLIRWARENFDFVVLDLPPMAAVSDAETVMEYVDGSLLVVRQNAAAAHAINKSVASLSGGKAKLLGCVLNNVHSSPAFSGEGYGYGRYGRYSKYGHYGYGRYSRRKSDAENQER